jgi:predicted Zn finger-like uncharacterized protein
MIVTCPNCEARYAVDPLAIGPAGRTVQCARCDNRWFQRVEGPRPTPDLVIRPPTRGAALPAVIEPKVAPPWRRYAMIGGAAVVVIALGVALVLFRSQIFDLVSRQASALRAMVTSAPAAAPAPTPTPAAAPSPAAAAANPAPQSPHLEVDLGASKVELVDGRYVVHGEIINSGGAPGTSSAVKFIFKKGSDVVGEKSYPQKLGPIAPGARLSFSQTLDEPPAGTTDIVPTVE